jgi:prepilin-type N-terminal cleavage/methylation domain-containing protein/prepilin-type processing-associated H-X9-DG protein
MLTRKRRGFTLIELLVVIAIIAILAAMLFPVFARARESARKIQCLSNVKNIAMAFQLYFTDFDRYPPAEHDPNVIKFFTDKGCTTTPGCCTYPTNVNPYLRWQVCIDEYVKNRDIWRCPSAHWIHTAGSIYGQVNWFQELQNNWQLCACGDTWPPGWGGSATDTMIQIDGCPAPSATLDQGAQELDYCDTHGVEGEVEKKLSAIDDPAKTLIIAEKGIDGYFDSVVQIAYPEICRVIWGRVVRNPSNCGGNGGDTEPVTADQIANFWHDASWRNQYTRHMGGNNLGFADGHAAWMAADAMIAAAGRGDLPPLAAMQVPPGSQ